MFAGLRGVAMKTKLAILLLALWLCSPAVQAFVWVNTLGGGDTIDLGDWSGGPLNGSLDFCVASVDGRWFSRNVSPYQYRLYRNDAFGSNTSPFEFILDGVAAGGGAQFDVSFTDVTNGPESVVQPNAWSAQNKTGERLLCSAGNARLTVKVSEAELLKLSAGQHSRSFSFEAQGGTGNESRAATINVQVNVQEMVQISGLNDIDLGSYNVGQDMTHPEQQVCVFSNTLSNSYTVTATSLRQGGGDAGDFLLDNGSSDLAYDVSFAGQSLNYNDPSGSIVGDPVVGCLATKAPLKVAVRSAQAAAAPPGTYNGTLVLRVNPV